MKNDPALDAVIQKALADAGWVLDPVAGRSAAGLRPLGDVVFEALRNAGYDVSPAESSRFVKNQPVEPKSPEAPSPFPSTVLDIDEYQRRVDAARLRQQVYPLTGLDETVNLRRLIFLEGDGPHPGEPLGQQLLWHLRALRRASRVDAQAAITPALLTMLGGFAPSDARRQLLYDTVLFTPPQALDELRISALVHAVNLIFHEHPPAPVGAVEAALSVFRAPIRPGPPPREPLVPHLLWWLGVLRESAPPTYQRVAAHSLLDALSGFKPGIDEGQRLLHDAVRNTHPNAFSLAKVDALERGVRMVFEDNAPLEAIVDVLRSAEFPGVYTLAGFAVSEEP